MKSFDLTFSGAVLPERDPGQVKQDFARLFSIQDSALIEEIFSGKTVVLRHNLDRKTAADYFRRINLLGGQATLVTSPKHRAVHRDEVLILESDNDCQPRIPPASVPKQAANEETNDTSCNQELNRLETLIAQTTQQSQRSAARLQRQKEQFDRIAAEELEKIDRLIQVNRTSVQKELAELSAIEEIASQSVSAQLTAVEKKRLLSTNRAARDIARVEASIEKSRADETAITVQINERLEHIQHTTEKEIRRLQQLLHDAQHQAEIDIAGLEQQLHEATSGSQLEIEELEHKKTAALHTMEEELKELEQQQEAAQKQYADHTAALRQREQNIHNREREEASRLQVMELEIKNKRDQGIAGVEQTIGQLRVQTQADLQQLQASELEIKRRQDLEPGEDQIEYSMEAEAPLST